MRRALIVIALLCTAYPARGSDKDWADKDVMPRKPDLKLTVVEGNQRKEIEVKYMVYFVVKEEGGMLLLKNGPVEGWGSKSDWILVPDAPAHYTTLIKADKDDAWAWTARGLAWNELGEYDNAIKDITEAIRIDPIANDYYNRGLAYRNKKEYALAIKDYTEAIRLASDDAEYYYERGHVYFDTSEYALAIKDYTKAIRLDPQARYYRDRGNTYRVAREFEKAHKDLNEAIRQIPDDSDFLNVRGLTYQDQKEHDEAIKAFTAAINADPKYEAPLINRANSYRDKKEFEPAMKDYEACLRLNPKNDFALRNRGIAWGNQKEYAKALKDYEAAIKADPKSEWNHNSMAWFLATCPDADFRDGKQAVLIATKACEIADWKNPGILDTLAAAYAEAGDFENAVKYQKKALAADNVKPDDVKGFKDRLKLYEQKKPYREQPE